jgi:type II secretory pathway pseudopilin PulG
MTDPRIALIALLIIGILALALGVVLAWHSYLSNQASTV